MPRIFIASVLALAGAATLQAATPVEELAGRICGEAAADISFELVPDSIEYYRVTTPVPGKVHIEGSTLSAQAVGLNNYLRHACNTDVSWYADDAVEMPPVLPVLGFPLEGKAEVPMRFFLNYCTFGYSMVYWDWSDWERLIDWMALNGVNMPLAQTGNEAIWQRVWRSFGLDDETIRAYFAGPAHLPWHRMLNLDRFDGPLPQHYIDSQEQLQKKIVARERSLGMKTVLPGFAGHVPPELGKVYSDAVIHPVGRWGGLNPDKYRSYFIEPTTALFDTIQARFIAEQTRAYGTDHIYGLDPFNEVPPPYWDEKFLHNVSGRIMKSLQTADDKARWFQMTWVFYYMNKEWTPSRIESYLTGVDPDRLILLDYYCDHTPLWERTNNFHGRPYIWCYLGNFGGNSVLSGDMDSVYIRTKRVLDRRPGRFEGIGGTLEGFDINPNMHTYALSRAWSSNAVADNPQAWTRSWAMARGGDEDRAVCEAWDRLFRDIYVFPNSNYGTMVRNRPRMTGHFGITTRYQFPYSNDSLFVAWGLLANAKTDNKAHMFDVVNVGRQWLGNHFAVLRDGFAKAYEAKDTKAMRRKARDMQELMADLDRLLATNHWFSLGKWLGDARGYGDTDTLKNYYETNARHIITTWSEEGDDLNEYANRDYAGLVRNYYAPRWQMFTDAAIAAVEAGKDFDADKFEREVAHWEWEWTKGHEPYPMVSGEDPKAVSKALYKKYKSKLR